MKKSTVTTGVYWVEIPEVDLRIVCGAPADVVKHLMRGGFISTVERNGVRFETGPNAVLLSDVSIQNGEFANLSEFPVLQMFYRQGMIIPGHPNNTGVTPAPGSEGHKCTICSGAMILAPICSWASRVELKRSSAATPP